MVDVEAVPYDDSEEDDSEDTINADSDPIVEIFDLLNQYEFGYEDYVDILKGLVERMKEENEEDDEEVKCKQRSLVEKLEEMLSAFKGD